MHNPLKRLFLVFVLVFLISVPLQTSANSVTVTQPLPQTVNSPVQIVSPAVTGKVKLALPLYIYPSANEKNWKTALNAAGDVDFIIANVYNGPDTKQKIIWTNMIDKAVAAGVKVYGYVDTGYTHVSGATVDRNVSRWLSFYPQISGIFFSGVSGSLGKLPYYKARYEYVKGLDQKLQVVINPGTNTDEGYMNVSDVNGIFTGTYSSWLKSKVPAWVNKYPKERFYAIVYQVPTEAKMKEVVKTAGEKNFGKIFVTSAKSSSDSLPSYFQSELNEIAPDSALSVSEPVTSPAPVSTPVPVSRPIPTPTPVTTPHPILAPVPVAVKGKVKTALPLYIYPSTGEKNWQTAIDATKQVDFIIANVSNGPSTEIKTNWTAMIKKSVNAGVKVYGYVHTDYGKREGKVVDEEIALWIKFYPQISGIFFDETAADISKVPYYKARYDYVKSISQKLQVVINPGTNTDEAYMKVSDVNVIFESGYKSWLTKKIPSWVSNYPKERFYAIVYDVPTETNMKEVVATAKARNFGSIFVTSASGPSAALPSYFWTELAEIAK
jgi:hypothetical protein